MNYISAMNFFLLLGLLSGSAVAADIQRGKELHDTNCVQCHIEIMGADGSGIYTREDRRIESMPALIRQVKKCRDSLGAQWPEDQIQDVIHFLNTRYYHFTK